MRIGLTKYGLPQVAVFPVFVLGIAVAAFFAARGVNAPLWAILTVEGVLAVVFVWGLAFFRDPYREITVDKNILLSPADGCVADIETIEKDDGSGEKTLRIGIFLNIFNVHINRAPCAVKVGKITYRKGKYKNAMSPEAGKVNESNDVEMVRLDSPNDNLMVRQVSGAIARRIVCKLREGDKLSGGEKFGMIKFGSRTELHLLVRENVNCLVKVGDKVKAGLTELVRYEK